MEHPLRQDFYGFGMALMLLWPVYVAPMIWALVFGIRRRRWRLALLVISLNASFFLTCLVVFQWLGDVVIDRATPLGRIVDAWGWVAGGGGPLLTLLLCLRAGLGTVLGRLRRPTWSRSDTFP
jgi:hypothetical protein